MLRVFLLAGASAALMLMALGGTTARAQWAGDDPGTRLSTEAGAATIGEQFFRVEWSRAVGRDGRPTLAGYVYNDYEEPAMNVQLRIHELDSSGREVTALLEPVDARFRRKPSLLHVPVPDSASYGWMWCRGRVHELPNG